MIIVIVVLVYFIVITIFTIVVIIIIIIIVTFVVIGDVIARLQIILTDPVIKRSREEEVVDGVRDQAGEIPQKNRLIKFKIIQIYLWDNF